MKVFTYGSLKRGFGNHYVMLRAGGRYIGEDAVGARLHAYCRAFPAACLDGTSTTWGEIYEVDATGLYFLDRLESEGSFYHRRVVKTFKGEDVSIYIMKEDEIKGEVIPSGVWEKRESR